MTDQNALGEPNCTACHDRGGCRVSMDLSKPCQWCGLTRDAAIAKYGRDIVLVRDSQRVATGVARPDAPYGGWSSEELLEIVQRMEKTNERIYWMMFGQGFGSDCHPFLEFCGLMSKYTQICHRAAEMGFQFPFASDHVDLPLPMEDHDAGYIAEKLACIFGPYLRANPDIAEMFWQRIINPDGSHGRE